MFLEIDIIINVPLYTMANCMYKFRRYVLTLVIVYNAQLPEWYNNVYIVQFQFRKKDNPCSFGKACTWMLIVVIHREIFVNLK